MDDSDATARSFEAPPELSTSTARRKGEKQPKTPTPKGLGEVSREPALANSAASSAITTHPGSPPGSSSGVASSESAAEDLAEGKDIVRATCKIKVDLADLIEGKEARDDHFKRRCGGPEKCPACRAQQIFRMCRREAARCANASMRMRTILDGFLVDRYQLAEQRAPKGAEWKQSIEFVPLAVQAVAGLLPQAERSLLEQHVIRVDGKGNKHFYAYPILVRMAPLLSAGIVSMIDKGVGDKWATDRWNALVSQEKSPPHYRYTNPIPLRKADVVLQRTADKRFLLSFSLRSAAARQADGLHGTRAKEFSIPLIARDEYMREALSLVTDDNARLGALQLSEDRLRPGRWYVRIAYRRQVTARTGGKCAAINKGMVCFLAGITETGSQWLYDGDDLAAYLCQIQNRRRRHQHQVRASSRIGHGRVRTLRPIEHLSGKAERWRETRCQTIARRFVDWLVKEGVTRLYLDDFTGIRDTPPEKLAKGTWIWERIQEWPYYQLQMRISSCCEEAGIEAIVRSAEGISSCCSFCGSRLVTITGRKIRCGECKKARHLDVSAAAVSLQSGERERSGGAAPGSEQSSKKKAARAGRMRTARKSTGNPAKGDNPDGAGVES